MATTTKVGTHEGADEAQQAPTITITPDEALAIVRAFHKLQRAAFLLEVPVPADIREPLLSVIDRAGLSALVA